jgi:AraC-like DNA-binding protein
VLAKRWLDQHPPVGKGYEAERQQQNVRWLSQFLMVLLVFQGIWLVHLVPYIIPGTRSALLDKFGWYPIYIPLAIMIYWLGLKGYLHSRSNTVEPATRKGSATALPTGVVNQVVDSLARAMGADTLYLDPELTVEKVGRHLQLPAKTISFVLNQYCQKSFSTFVNEYRVEAVKQRLTDPASEHLTLTGIAFECGFNSQATFQRTFKQMTGVSPREYLGKQGKITSQIRI